MSNAPEAVYIMASRPRGALYVGRTTNLIWRTWQHRTGAMRGYTRRYAIKQLVWFEWHEGFEAAARRGSFVAAAEELNVTPAAIGQQVRQLEALIGAPLFVREGRGVRLTERGAAGIDRLGRAFELMGEASSAMREASGEVELVIGAPADFAATGIHRCQLHWQTF